MDKPTTLPFDKTSVGTSPWRVDGIGLVTGSAKFTDDIFLKGMLHAKILGSPHAHARILDIDTTEAERLPGVVIVLTHKNVPRVAHTTAGQGYPEPSPYDAFMFDTKVRFVGDRVACVAAESADIAEQALKLINVKYELLQAVFDVREAMKDGAPVIHDETDSDGIHDRKHNIAAHYDVEIGNLANGLKEADFVVEEEFETQYAQHCPLEPHICIGYLDDNHRIVLRTATQVPWHARRIVAQCLQIPVNQIRVIKPRIGGGFGAKQEIILEDLCALIAQRTRRPVKIEMTRREEFMASRTRDPSIVKMKIGVKKDGTFTAMEQIVTSWTGGYGTHSLTLLTNVGSKTLPFYRCKNVKFWGDSVYTNTPITGAYRGYGATQGAFAIECMMDIIADKLGIDPLDLRRQLHIQVGETNPVFAALGEGKEGHDNPISSCGLDECIERGAEAIGWKQKHRLYRDPAPSGTKIKRGIGVACLMQGSGIAGIDMASARIKMNEDGSFNLTMGATDLGTGSDTVLAQIAAQVLGITADKILTYSSDTDMTPFDKGAYASSTTYVSGGAAKKAAEDCRALILKVAAEMLKEDAKDLFCENAHVVSRKTGKKAPYPNIIQRSLYGQSQVQIQGEASHISYVSPPPFAAHFAEVEVDTETGKVRVVNYVAATDCGVAVNPKLAQGQVEGAVMNGISYALSEQMVFDERGRMLNPSFFDYKIFTTADAPPIKTILVETFEPSGPFGAKSIAEIGINGPLPAIANAIYDACGIRMKKAPFTPERVLAALTAKK
ncbi:MAG TPA: molybdopterin cofactor-binding domain-containing protein [Verrucomicrobiae bacterium]|nr:molybdopterin cofactor-binding domain-containing protein [Verrucomicrobiae bacterium]